MLSLAFKNRITYSVLNAPEKLLNGCGNECFSSFLSKKNNLIKILTLKPKVTNPLKCLGKNKHSKHL